MIAMHPLSMARDVRRWARIDWADRLLLCEAAIVLARAALAIRFRPFRAVMARAVRPVRPPLCPAGEKADRIRRARWAVEACARRLPWKSACFHKGLALQRMLRRRGVATDLHYGIAHDGDSAIKAHVWVTDGAEPIIGGEEALEYRRVGTFSTGLAS